jgi:hypothetical protein
MGYVKVCPSVNSFVSAHSDGRIGPSPFLVGPTIKHKCAVPPHRLKDSLQNEANNISTEGVQSWNIYNIVKCRSTLQISFSVHTLHRLTSSFLYCCDWISILYSKCSSTTTHLCFKVLKLVLFLELSSISFTCTLQFANSKLRISYCRVLHTHCFALFITPLLLLPFHKIIRSCVHVPIFVLFAVSDVSLF